jgi:hypothetical protein
MRVSGIIWSAIGALAALTFSTPICPPGAGCGQFIRGRVPPAPRRYQRAARGGAGIATPDAFNETSEKETPQPCTHTTVGTEPVVGGLNGPLEVLQGYRRDVATRTDHGRREATCANPGASPPQPNPGSSVHAPVANDVSADGVPDAAGSGLGVIVSGSGNLDVVRLAPRPVSVPSVGSAPADTAADDARVPDGAGGVEPRFANTGSGTFATSTAGDDARAPDGGASAGLRLVHDKQGDFGVVRFARSAPGPGLRVDLAARARDSARVGLGNVGPSGTMASVRTAEPGKVIHVPAGAATSASNAPIDDHGWRVDGVELASGLGLLDKLGPGRQTGATDLTAGSVVVNHDDMFGGTVTITATEVEDGAGGLDVHHTDSGGIHIICKGISVCNPVTIVNGKGGRRIDLAKLEKAAAKSREKDAKKDAKKSRWRFPSQFRHSSNSCQCQH